MVDVGESLNPAIGKINSFDAQEPKLYSISISDIGQIEGAFVQGLGYVTMEQLIKAPSDGMVLTTGPGTYKVNANLKL